MKKLLIVLAAAMMLCSCGTEENYSGISHTEESSAEVATKTSTKAAKKSETTTTAKAAKKSETKTTTQDTT
ncbi:MAG: hypothetical protein K2J26_08080, partial [Ruminococcus sp.]|nr:hypothetical protein [Ruminococcus sp.]